MTVSQFKVSHLPLVPLRTDLHVRLLASPALFDDALRAAG